MTLCGPGEVEMATAKLALSFEELDEDAPPGHYEVDAFIDLMPVNPLFQKGGLYPEGRPLRSIRSYFNDVARVASSSVAQIATQRGEADTAQQFLDQITDISDRIKRMRSADVAVLARSVVSRVDPIDWDRADADGDLHRQQRDALFEVEHRAVRITDLAGQLRDEIEQFSADHKVATAAKNDKDWLAHQFVEVAAAYWETETGRAAPRSKDGPFVRFIAAGWRDLNLPAFVGDAESSLGRISGLREKSMPPLH